MAAEARSRGGVAGRRPRPDPDARRPRRRRHRRRDPRAADHPPLPVGIPRRRQGGADRARNVLPPVVHAADRLLRDRRGGDRTAPGGTAVRRADVRADPQQPVRDRHVRHLRVARRERNLFGGAHHVRREDGPRRGHHVRRRRHDPGPVAVAPTPGVPLAPPVRLEPPRGAPPRQARALGRGLRRGEPAGVRRDHRVHGEVPRRLPDLLERVHPVPAPPLDRGGVHLHGAPPAHVEPMGRRRHRRAANVLLARDPRHDRGDRPGGARLHRARGADHAPAAAAWTSARKQTWRRSHTRCRRSRWVSRSSRLFQLLTRTFYSMQDTRTPAIVNVGAAVVNVGANLLFLSFGWGVWCLALGHATSYVFATVVSLIVLRKRLGRIDGARILSTLLRVIPASLLAAGAAFLTAQGVRHAFGSDVGNLSRLVEVSAGVLVGLLVFGVSTLIVRIDEADEVKDAVLRRFRR